MLVTTYSHWLAGDVGRVPDNLGIDIDLEFEE